MPGVAAKLTFSLDGKRLIVESSPPPPSAPAVKGSVVIHERAPTIRHTVWNLLSRSVGHLKPMAYTLGGSLLSPDLRTLAVWRTMWGPRETGARIEHEFHDLATHRKVAKPSVWKWLDDSTEPLAFSPDGKVAAAKLTTGSVGLFEVASGKKISTITMRDDRWLSVLPGVVFSGDGKVLAVPLLDSNSLALCGVADGKVLRRFDKCESGSVLALTTDGKRLALGSPKSGEVRIFEVATGEQAGSWKGHPRGVRDLTYSADGKVLFAASDQVVLGWDATAEREVARLRGHRAPVTVLALSPDGKRLASGGADKSVRLWDISAYAPADPSRERTSDEKRP